MLCSLFNDHDKLTIAPHACHEFAFEAQVEVVSFPEMQPIWRESVSIRRQLENDGDSIRSSGDE